MYTTYKNDTFSVISRRVFGSEKYAKEISAVNPDLIEPLRAGLSVVLPSTIPGLTRIEKSSPNAVTIIINGKEFKYWTSITIERQIDAVTVVNFEAPIFRDVFKPLSFSPVEVLIGGKRIMNGMLLNVLPHINENKTCTITSYARSGALTDCTPGQKMFPVEYSDANLQYIANNMCGPFGLKVEFPDGPGPTFGRVACEQGSHVMAFLARLSRQRDLIISDNDSGGITFKKSVKPGNPVESLEQGKFPLISISADFNPQQYYSHITGIQPTIIGLPGGVVTVKNKFLPEVFRPYVFDVPDTVDNTVTVTAHTQLSRMLGNCVRYTVRVADWRTSKGELWKPNTTVLLTAPDAMIYNRYEFIIRSVSLTKSTSSGEIAELGLTLPGAYSSEVPKGLPWD